MDDKELAGILEKALDEAVNCKEGDNEKLYLIVVGETSGKSFYAKLSVPESRDLFKNHYAAFSNIRELIQILKNIRMQNTTYKNNDCVTHAAFCFPKHPCYVSDHQDPFLRLLRELSSIGKTTFENVLNNTALRTVYYNSPKQGFKIAPQSCNWLAKRIFMVFGGVFYNRELDEIGFNQTMKLGTDLIENIDWQQFPWNTTRTSPIFTCNYLGNCYLYSLLEFYDDEIPKAVEKIEKYQSVLSFKFPYNKFNELHARNKPKECYSKKSCEPLVIYINENGETKFNETSYSYTSDSGNILAEELDILYGRFNNVEQGLYKDILKIYGEKHCKELDGLCPYFGIKHIQLSIALKQRFKDYIKTENGFEGCSSDYVFKDILKLRVDEHAPTNAFKHAKHPYIETNKVKSSSISQMPNHYNSTASDAALTEQHKDESHLINNSSFAGVFTTIIGLLIFAVIILLIYSCMYSKNRLPCLDWIYKCFRNGRGDSSSSVPHFQLQEMS